VSDEALMDTAEVARYLKMHAKTIVSMVERGELKAYKVGRHWRYRKSDIEAYLEQRQSIPKTVDQQKKRTQDPPDTNDVHGADKS
jgi:excisionase family DNA binding protein